MTNWQPIETAPEDDRVLVFSPGYGEHDPMRYRVINAEFIALCADVTHWMPLEPPQ